MGLRTGNWTASTTLDFVLGNRTIDGKPSSRQQSFANLAAQLATTPPFDTIMDVASTPAATTGVDTLLSVKSGAIVKSHKPGFHSEDYLGVLTTDAAIEACRDAAIAAGGCVIISRPWTIRLPFNVLSHTHVEIMGGASLVAHATEFTGDWLIEVGADGLLSDEDGIAEFFSITGEGKLDCGNDIDEGVRVIKGRFGDIDIKEIHGANECSIRVGTATNAYKSYEIGIRRTRAYYNNVANTATSKAFYFQQATDCRIIDTYSIGYRKGIRADTTTARIVMLLHHVWVRPVHGPLTHGIDNAGQWNTIDLCDFDTPTNNMGVDGGGALLGPDPSITTVYGCYNSNFNTIMGTNYLFMNAALKSDDLIVGIHETQDSYSRFGTLMVFTENSSSYRFKKAISLFGGGTTSVTDVIHPGGSFFSGSPAGLSAVHSVTGQNIVLNGTHNFAVRSIHTGVTSSAEMRVTGNAGTNRDYVLQAAGVSMWKLRANDAAHGGSNTGSDFYLNAQDDTGTYLFTALEIARATGIAKFINTVEATSFIQTATETAANIAAIASTINTVRKTAGKMIWDSTNNRMMRASGTTAAAPWHVIDGSATVTPA